VKKILIVDDHTIVREGVIRLLQQLLEPPPDFDEASNGQQAIDMGTAGDYSLVLLDISLPGRDGLDVLRQLRQINPKTPVIVLSMHPDEQYAVRAFQAGAAGYITKGSASDDLQGAIEKVFRGGRYVSAFQAELLAEAVGEDQENTSFHKLLSDREYQFVSMMVSGMTMTEIARELSLSTKTISTYRTRVLEKLHLRTNADIISYWITHNLPK
jgi:two-component system, NarL family, invasion response regulator UvrY